MILLHLGKLGLKRKQLLKPEAVPTILPAVSVQRHRARPRRTSVAFEKREQSRVSLINFPLK